MPTISETKQQIEKIISSSHYGDENIFTDSSKAAKQIIDYLEENDLIRFPIAIDILNTAIDM